MWPEYRHSGESFRVQLGKARDSLNVLLACLTLCGCVLLANPFVNSSFNDDWSYAHVALSLAATNHFHYNGWGAPTIVVQSVWAAFWIRCFGFSFTLLRLASLPFSLAFVALTYALARRVGLAKHLAFFAAVIIATSPLFVPLAASFMTDTYGGAFALFCLYAAIRSAEARTSRASAAWLWLLTSSGILGGSERQIVWVTPLALVPFLFWSYRGQRRLRLQAGLAFLVCVIALWFVTQHFKPGYSAIDLSGAQIFQLLRKESLRAAFKMFCIFLTTALLSLPALLAAPRVWLRLPSPSIIAAAVLCLVTVGIFGLGSSGIVPFLGTMLTPYGILGPAVDELGYRPILLGFIPRYGLTFLLLFALALWACLLAQGEVRNPFTRTRAMIFGLFTVSYLGLLIPGALTAFIFDRYSLPLVPILVIWVLLMVQQATPEVSVLARVCLLVFAGYGIVTTHDYFAALEARVKAADLLLGRRVAPDRFSIGFEHDGWTQLMLTGHIRPLHLADNRTGIPFWFWFYTTALHPEYEALAGRRSEALPNTVLTVPFLTWTPPFRRQIAIVHLSKPFQLP